MMLHKVVRARKWYEEGQLLLRKGEHESSARAFTHAMQAGWSPETAYLSRGVANLLAGHPEKAIADFTEVLKRDRSNLRARYYRGSARMMSGGYLWAVDDFTRVLEGDPDHGMALFGRGVARAHVGDYDEASVDIKRAVMAAERDAQHFADDAGIWRNHLEGVLGVLHQHTELSAEETAKLKAFFEG